MTAAEIVQQLKPLGAESYKRVLFNHGVVEPVFGVKIADLKPFQKRIKKDYRLSLDLYETGIYDAQYLAGLIADEHQMTREDLGRWVARANCSAISGTVVASVAAESRYGRELALEWIEAPEEDTAQAGWATLSGLVALKEDAHLDLEELSGLLEWVARTIHPAPNRVRYAMNGFVISLGSYVANLTDSAIRVGEQIGRVSVDMGNTACEVPYAPVYIEKVRQRGTIGKKRKTVRC